MIFQLVPLPDGSKLDWSVTTQLNGTDVQLRYLYNTRLGYWTLQMNAPSGEVMLAGQVVKPRRNLMTRITSEDRSMGVMFLVWNEASKVELPGRTDLGNYCRMLFAYEEDQ